MTQKTLDQLKHAILADLADLDADFNYEDVHVYKAWGNGDARFAIINEDGWVGIGTYAPNEVVYFEPLDASLEEYQHIHGGAWEITPVDKTHDNLALHGIRIMDITKSEARKIMAHQKLSAKFHHDLDEYVARKIKRASKNFETTYITS